MTIIHFIWCGPFLKDSFEELVLKGIRSFCRVYPDHHVMLWGFDCFIKEARSQLFGLNVQLMRILGLFEDTVEPELVRVDATLSAAGALLASFCDHDAPASGKDLLSLLILKQYGGYYFDTTTIWDHPFTVQSLGFPPVDHPQICVFRAPSTHPKASKWKEGSRYYTLDSFAFAVPQNHPAICTALEMCVENSSPLNAAWLPVLRRLNNKFEANRAYLVSDEFAFLEADRTNPMRRGFLGAFVISPLNMGFCRYRKAVNRGLAEGVRGWYEDEELSKLANKHFKTKSIRLFPTIGMIKDFHGSHSK